MLCILAINEKLLYFKKRLEGANRPKVKGFDATMKEIKKQLGRNLYKKKIIGGGGWGVGVGVGRSQ